MTDLVTQIKGIHADDFNSDAERQLAVDEIYALLSRIESPYYTAWRFAMTVPAQYAALQTSINTGLLEKWLQSNNGGKKSATELRDLIDCDLVLLERMLRHLSATHMLREDEQGKYEMTPYTTSLITENYKVTLDFFSHITMPVSLHLPAFLNDIKHKNPDGVTNDCFQHWKSMSFFEWLGKDPVAAGVFNAGMKTTSTKRGHFTESFLWRDDNDDGTNLIVDETLLVDIGGNMGHDVQEFRVRYPSKTGQLVVQDLAHVIEEARAQQGLDPAIVWQIHDFFTPQPIKGAKFYLLHDILHDWPDAKVRQILENVKPALKANHSKLLIQEIVIPSRNASPQETSTDLVVMGTLSGMERTEEHWHNLITSVGYKIIKIWRNPVFTEAVIEVELAWSGAEYDHIQGRVHNLYQKPIFKQNDQDHSTRMPSGYT